jgi:peroxiredoxin
MALTPSTMMPLGTKAPSFSLLDVVTGKSMMLDDLKSPTATVVMFICNHCPFVKHIQETLVSVANAYIAQGVAFIAINSNDIKAYPEDAPEAMKEIATALKYPFPYLFDEDQTVAKAYDAACTPDIFVFGADLECVYRGQFDEARPNNSIPVTGKDLKEALTCLIEGRPVPSLQKPSIGCNIKWKA